MPSARRASKRRQALVPPTLGSTLKAARLRAGLTQVELAERLGVSQEPISAGECGRLPRHSTLMAYLGAIPWLSAHDLLPQAGVPRAASPAAWSCLRDVFGFAARSVRVELVRASGRAERCVRVEGMAVLNGDESVHALTGLLSAASEAEFGTRMRIRLDTNALPTARKPLRLDDARGSHSFWFDRVRGRLEAAYELRGPAESTGSLAFGLGMITDRLELVIRGAGSPSCERAQPWVRPETIPRHDVVPHLARLMHPQGAAARLEGGAASWRIDRPLPGFEYGLDCGDGPRLTARPKAWTLAETLRRARETAGLSLRDVATRASVCHASVAYAETGRDPRLGTLAGYLEAIPGLSPQELMPATCESGSLTPDETWDLYRDIYGYEIAEIRKTLTIAADGTSTNVIETIGLRPLRGDLREMRVRMGLHRAVSQTSESVLQDVHGESSELKVRRIAKTEGAVTHEFIFPARLATGKLSYVRRFAGAKFIVDPTPPPRGADPSAVRMSGAGLSIEHPVRRVVLQVVMPARLRPGWLKTATWATALGPSSSREPFSDLAKPPACRIRSTRARTSLSATLEMPLIGTTLAIAWGTLRG